jgi:ABC-type uncharacterized transport system involved in gliding motility auxiliary subunit
MLALAVATLLFIAVNVVAGNALRGFRLDLTEGGLYTLSDGTRRTLQGIDEPVALRLYFSRNLGETVPRFAAYHARVRELLEQYVALAEGKLQLQLLDPEPFSEAEDRAVADGLQGVPVSAAGDLGYFGLAGSNSTDGHGVIPFLNMEREPFLEYDLTKLIHGLAHPDLPKLGLLSGIDVRTPMPGAAGRAGAASGLRILDQIREFFDLQELEPDVDAIPEGVGVLMLIAPARLGEDALRAVDRFVQNGGRVLAFLDPNTESAPPASAAGTEDAGAATAQRLLAAWGVRLVADKVAGDLDAARRVSTGSRSGGVGDYVAWLSLGQTAFDAGDPIMANIERINLASAGILEGVEAASTTMTPILVTGPRSMAIDVDRVRFMPDVAQLFREFRPSGQALVLAARVQGEAPAAFPGDAPAETAKRPITAIVVADVDMLYDRFWLTTADFFGEQVLIPNANNADFVINALEALTEGDALIGLRGRGTSYRPFTLIEEYRRDAERLYRAKEQELQDRLRALQQKVRGLQGAESEAKGEALVSAEAKAAIEQFRGEMLAVRRELRDVQHALRRDIDQLESWVKFFNIAAVPLAIFAGVVIVVLWRRLRPLGPGAARAT